METWYDADSRKKTKEQMLEWLKSADADRLASPCKIIVGTDSHLHGREFRFVSVVLVYHEGKGGNYFYSLNYEKRDKYKGNQQLRMFREVEISMELCEMLFNDVGILTDEVHLDVSPEEANEFTSSFSNSLKGLVKSYGYSPVIKPASYVANAVADKHSK